MLNKKSTRIAFGIIFLLILVISIVPNFYLYTSIDGVVNARTTTLTSPIEGILQFSQPTTYGKYLKKGEIIGEVTNERVNRSFVNELNTEKKTLTSRISSLNERVKQYTALSSELEKHLTAYQKFSAKQLRSMIKQEERKLAQEKAEYERAKKEFDANKHLESRNVVKKREFERSESNFFKSSERIMEIKHNIEELNNSLSAVEAGAFLGDGHNDSPYSKQRMDQLVIEISQAKTALNESVSRVEGIEQQIKTEQDRIKKVERFQLVSPFNSLVWRLPLTPASTVVIDSELIVLLDCSSVFLDIAVSESQFSNISPGNKIQYRLIGESDYHVGTVFALRGSGSEISDKNFAATLNKDKKKEFRVWISVTPKDLNLNAENFFQVGRRVEARIPRKWHVFKELTRFFNVF